MSDLEKFLRWCLERGIRPRRLRAGCWEIAGRHVKVTIGGVSFWQKPVDVYFDDDSGAWRGGTNWLWDAKVPWLQKAK